MLVRDAGLTTPTHPADVAFPTTAWTLVVQAPPGERSARLRELLARCWRPIFAFIRQSWSSNDDDALDLTQEFVVHMMEGDSLDQYQRERTRFRNFIKACLKNFLHRVRRDATRQKRGGGRPALSFDDLATPIRTLVHATAGETPDAIFDREWAAGILWESSEQLRKDLEREGGAKLFSVWQMCVLDRASDEGLTYKEAAARLGMTESDVREALARLRRRYRSILLVRVANWVSCEDGLFAELAELLSLRTGFLP